jgi:hypothetical protein
MAGCLPALVSRSHGSRHRLRGPGVNSPLSEARKAREDLIGTRGPDESRKGSTPQLS